MLCYRCTLVLFSLHFYIAAYTYYRSLNQEESLKWRGKQDDSKRVRRCLERLIWVGSFVVWSDVMDIPLCFQCFPIETPGVTGNFKEV